MKLATYTRYWTILTFLALIITSLGSYFAYIWVSDTVKSFVVYKTAVILFSSQQFYMSIFLNLGVIFFADLAYIYIKTEYQTSIIDIFNKIVQWKKENVKEIFEAYVENNTESNIELVLNSNITSKANFAQATQ